MTFMTAESLVRPRAAVLRHWQWLVLASGVLVSRIYLLYIYDVELSQDGFEAVRTLTILQAQGASAVPRDLLDRFILHPAYMLVLLAWRTIIPGSVDFYYAARLLSTLLACVAVVLIFEFVRRAFGEWAGWIAALFLAFAPSFLWESVSILSSTLFLASYIAVLVAIYESRFRLAALLALLAALTRYEGAVLVALVVLVLLYRDVRARQFRMSDWATVLALALAFPLALVASGWLAVGNGFEFLGAQSMASIWLRFLAPGDFAKRGAFFVTGYSQLFPPSLVVLGLFGAVLAIFRQRGPATGLLIATPAMYLVFFEALVWFNYTTLEVRFLMYPGLPLLVFAAVAVAGIAQWLMDRLRVAAPGLRWAVPLGAAAIVTILCVQSYQQGIAGMNFVYNSMASQREMANELAQLIPPHQATNLVAYTGTSGALDLYGRQRGLDFTFTDFRFVPDAAPEQFLRDHEIRLVIYPVGNAFAKAKYPYLGRFETQAHSGVTFQPLTQFATSTDNQLYSIWAVSW